MPSSAQVSCISTPFSHFTTSTATSRDLCDEPTTFKISQLIADFIGLRSQRTLNSEIEVSAKQVDQRNSQVSFSQTSQEEISELINGYVIAQSLFQTSKRRGETRNKLKISQDFFLSKVFGLVQHKTAQKIILAKCDFMAQGVLQFKNKASQHHLYINYSFITRSLPLFKISFQSKEFSNLFEHLSKTPLIQEHQLWYVERKDNSQFEKNYKALKECSDAEELESHEKCSTASRSSITAHERNSEMLDILESSPQKTNFELHKAQPSTAPTLVYEYYEGFFVGDMDIDFNPSDNHLSNFDQEKKPISQKLHNNQDIIQLKLFTLPPIQNFIQTNHMMGFPSSSSFPAQHQRANHNNSVHHQASSTKNVKTKNLQSQKQKEKLQRKPKKQEEKGLKLWDMISVNGKLKKN